MNNRIYIWNNTIFLMENEKCPDCNNTGIVKDASGVHTCFKCLVSGRLDQHSEKIRESKIRL